MQFVVCDTESTGIEPGSRLVELAALHCDEHGRILDRFASLVNPGRSMPADVREIHGLDDTDLRGAPDAATVLRAWLRWLPANAKLVMHHPALDVDLLCYEAALAGITMPALRVVDSVPLARALGEPDLRLQAIAQRREWQDAGPAHRALPDAELVRRLLVAACETLTAPQMTSLCTGRLLRGRWRPVTALPTDLAELARCHAAGTAFAFAYTDRRGASTSRSITPWGWAEVDGRLRFHGFCHLRQARRHFAAERCRPQEALP